jgi:diguanylate cyclase (GGDEF)-like protein
MGRRRRRADGPSKQNTDVTALFAGVVSIPLLLPLVIKLSALAFAVPFVVLGIAAVRCWSVSRTGEGRRAIWGTLAIANVLASVAAALALAALVVSGVANAGFYLGAAASAALLLAMVEFARRSVKGASLQLLVDGLLVVAVVVAVGIWFVVLPGFAAGDAILTYVFLVDMLAVAIALVATVGRSDPAHRRVGFALTAGCAAATIGDGFVSAAAADQIAFPSVGVAAFWALAGAGLLVAADRELRPVQVVDEDSGDAEGGRLWLWARVGLPLVAVLSFPAIAAAMWLSGESDPGSTSFFTTFFVVTLLIAFGRQAYLIVDNRQAVTRERHLRAEAVRRTEELQALTALATTMTETLDETQIVERGLDALRLGAGASSAALHMDDDHGATTLRATVGDWPTDQPWVDPVPASSETRSERRGAREIFRLPLSARDRHLGVVTLVRREAEQASQPDAELVELLTGQLAVAVQNARDYSETVEASLRDPLTGLYNRRFLHEALQKEIHRNERYGSPVSFVIFDVDDFKRINDTYGHAVGDEVLCEIAGIVRSRIRPVDSFARMGGEEFALLMPETSQLDALAVSDRLRRAVASTDLVPDWTVTVSGGLASSPDDAASADAMQTKADAALYWAKKNGKNMCAIASEVVISNDDRPEGAVISHLYALSSSVDSEQLKTPDHSANVAEHAVGIGAELGLAPERLVRLRRAALLHDVGKIAVDSDVLSKPAALDADEMAEVKRHPEVGGAMLLHAGLSEEAEWVRHHHERIDGTGYPDGLGAERIPLEARIIFVADAFEAMTAARPYRRPLTRDEALQELRACAGSQFDPRVVEAFAVVLARTPLREHAVSD